MSLEKASPLNRQSSTASCDPHIRRRVYGVWEAVYYLEDDGLLGAKSLKESCSYIVLGAYAYLRLLNEIFRLSPVMLIMYALSKYWGNMQEAILLYLSSEFLHALEDGVRHGGISRESVGRAVAFRLCGLICLTWFKWHVRSLRPKVSQLLDSHYDIKIMKARMRANSLSPSEDSTQELSRHTPYYAFEALLLFACNLSTFTTHLFLLYRATRSGGTLVFSLLAILQPLQRLLAEKNIFEYQLFIYLKDACYRRLRALREMSRGRKQDYLAGDFSSYILEEYKKAYQNLRGTCIDDFHHQVTTSSTPTSQIGSAIVGDLPMIYCAWIALTSPSTLSITSVAIMQQSATSIRLSVQTVMSAIDGLRENTKAVKDFYAALDVKEYLREGEVPYPPKDDVESTRGMAINLRDVKYDYPGTHSTSSALKGISLDIQPGHLIVIVGANGSGKSTLIKLLTRLHDPTSGEISIDGIPASDYKVSDLRRATATFTQDHELFPLSLYENIGLGDCTRIRDEDAVMKAAEMGGAMDLISKLEEGADTILEPMMSVQSYLTAPIDDNHPIIKAMDELERETDISGGEKQRVVAARTFMHINSGNVKLVAVDEPSSALDPEAELSLFQHLIEAREGKTMIFVTHRFGHLTKFADMIVCMKEGEIAEQGSHKELIELDGEYAKLYNIQASAFTDTTQ